MCKNYFSCLLKRSGTQAVQSLYEYLCFSKLLSQNAYALERFLLKIAYVLENNINFAGKNGE
jgi:hypothetical protein